LEQEASERGIHFIEEQAERLSQRRAYILPAEEILSRSWEIARDLKLWGIPAAELADTDALIKNGIERTLVDKELNEARANFRRLLERLDYWSWYVSFFHSRHRNVSIVLMVCALLLLVASIVLAFWWPHPIAAFLCAGACGASVSILLKPTRVIPYAKWASYLPKIFGRAVAGIIATTFGLALLASGIVDLQFPSTGGSVSQILRCWAEVQCSAAENIGKCVLIGMAIVLGFSERALPSLRDTLGKPFGRLSPSSSARVTPETGPVSGARQSVAESAPEPRSTSNNK
jgi:hypothetical protein